jgi:hypothetical protein
MSDGPRSGAIDFPGFVGELVRGTFEAIVNVSVRQMDAYSALLKDVAATFDRAIQRGCGTSHGDGDRRTPGANSDTTSQA